MDREFYSVPKAETSDTPESFQECLVLADTIDAQLDDWTDLLRSRHPAMRQGIAHIIVDHCTPKEPIAQPETSPFENGRTPAQAQAHTKRLKQHATVAHIAQNPAYDEHVSDNDVYGDYFDHIQTFVQNPAAPPAPAEAVQYLHRLFNAREQFSNRLNVKNGLDPQLFARLLQRIVEDMY